MRLAGKFLVVTACFSTLFLMCYGRALFADRQFGYRDSAQYYYPLHQRVQLEWSAGRWPLWEGEENAGMPLLGNPTAAVLYPAKLVFAILPYAWGARVYTVVHSLLAFVTMLVLMRSWRTSWVGSTLSALSYAFGVPVLFQYSNVIYLVGAAWLPLGFHAVDRWVRLGQRWGLIELAGVLAMQNLGGDTESAYLLGCAAMAYAGGFYWNRRKSGFPGNPSDLSNGLPSSFPTSKRSFPPRVRTGLLVLFGLLLWVMATLVLARWLPKLRPTAHGSRALPWMAWVPTVIALTWGLAAIGYLIRTSRNQWRSHLARAWLGLGLSAGLSTLLIAAQLLPVAEFMRQTVRASTTGPHDLYPFSLEPFRLVELAFPNILGSYFEGNTYWRDVLTIPGCRREIWTPSLYLGGLTFVLGCGAWSIRKGPPWGIWLSAIVGVSLLASLGQYASPIWVARLLIYMIGATWPRDLIGPIGPLDSAFVPPIRLDGFLRDGDSSLYWWLATLLPGFRQFRFPAKLFTFTALGLTALAGLGWDRLRVAGTSRISHVFRLLLATSVLLLTLALFGHSALLTAFRSSGLSSVHGPLDAEGAFRAILRSLSQTGIISALGLLLLREIRRRPQWAGICVLIITTADLAIANSQYVATVAQSDMDAKPELLRVLEEEERRSPSSGPFRVYRMAAWEPSVWLRTASPDRASEVMAWERDTLQPKYGINYGIEYTHAFGVGGLLDFEWFFGDFPVTIDTPEAARLLGVRMGQRVVYYPRRSFDLWNTRYFIVPSNPQGWQVEYRGFASFLFQSETIYPRSEVMGGHDRATPNKDWVAQHDFQLIRNLAAMPRSWIVHDARWVNPADPDTRNTRAGSIHEILYANDPLWHDPTREAFDPRIIAWVDVEKRAELAPYLSGRPPGQTERVVVAYPNPQRTELDATLESPGLVILADVYYPGWELRIDGNPAPIYQVNRMMRAAAVPAGQHRLVYSYSPRSFQFGCVLSLVGLGILVLLSFACIKCPVDPLLANEGGLSDLQVSGELEMG